MPTQAIYTSTQHKVLLLVLCMLSAPGFAINKCTDAAGHVSFQDAPCDSGSEAVSIAVKTGKQRLSIPGSDWDLTYAAPGMKERERQYQDLHFQYLANTGSGFVMSVFVEPARGKGHDVRSCANYYWRLTSNNPTIMESTVDRVDGDEFLIVSYGVKVPRQQGWIVQGNYNIYGFRDGRCLDIHLSKLFPDDNSISFQEFIQFAASLEYVDK